MTVAEWWQEYQGFVVVGGIIALLVIRLLARRWSARFRRRAADNAAREVAGTPLAREERQWVRP